MTALFYLALALFVLVGASFILVATLSLAKKTDREDNDDDKPKTA